MIFFLKRGREEKKRVEEFFGGSGSVYLGCFFGFFACKRTFHCHFPALLTSKTRLMRKQKPD